MNYRQADALAMWRVPWRLRQGRTEIENAVAFKNKREPRHKAAERTVLSAAEEIAEHMALQDNRRNGAAPSGSSPTSQRAVPEGPGLAKSGMIVSQDVQR